MSRDKRKFGGRSLSSLRDNEYVGNTRETDRDWDIDGSGTPLDRIWRDWAEAGQYHAQINLERAVRVYKDYAEGSGRQERYMPDGIPHVTIPLVPSIINQKVSTICQDDVRIEFQSNRSERAGNVMTDFCAAMLDRLGFQRIVKRWVRAGLITPASFLHCYWDEDYVGPDAVAKGSIRIEVISCLNVRVANKAVKDMQQQEWIIIASREKVKRVRNAIKDQSKRDLVKPDFADFNSDLTEDGSETCTVLTRYFRVDGAVYFEKAVRGTMLCPPTPLDPELEILTAEAWEALDPEHQHSPDMEPDGKNDSVSRNRFSLYPIEILVFTEDEDSYLGIADVENMIAGQNTVNAMYSLAVQNGIDIQAKYVVKEDALENQTITNEVGEVLVDHSRGSGDGIKILAGTPQMTNQMLQLPLSLIETIKKLKAASDVTMGDVSKEYSATAISLLQTAAEKPTEDMVSCKEEAVQRFGRILLQFFKFYYEDTRYMFRLRSGERKDISKKFGIPLDEVPTRAEGRFTGTDFLDDVFDVNVTVGQGGKISQATAFAFLQSFFTTVVPQTKPSQQRALIDQVPRHVLPNKERLLDLIDEDENGIIAQLTAENEQLKAAVKSLQGGAKELGTIVNMQQRYINEYQNESGRVIADKDRQIANLLSSAEAAGGSAPQKGNDGQKPVS